MKRREQNFMGLYDAWKQLRPGSKAELRRVATPAALLEVPAFYRLFCGRGNTEWEKQAYQRLIFCLPCIKQHTEKPVSLGASLARNGDSGQSTISEKRLFQIVRSESPNDIIQLRRIMKMAEPTINWPLAAKQLWFWNARSKRDLLESYFMNQSKQTK